MSFVNWYDSVGYNCLDKNTIRSVKNYYRTVEKLFPNQSIAIVLFCKSPWIIWEVHVVNWNNSFQVIAT